MSRNTKTSSASAASLAARTLNNGSSSGLERSLAGSVLAQRGTASQTGARMEERPRTEQRAIVCHHAYVGSQLGVTVK